MRYEWAIKRKEKNITKYEHWPYLKVKCSFTEKKSSKRAEQATKFLYDKSFCKSTM